MNGFELDFHTKIFFGPGAEERIGTVLREDGISRVLVHHDDIAVELGLLGRILDHLEAEGIVVTLLGGVRPNPEISLVRQGIRKCTDEGVECVVAVGGGSTIDSSKAIVIGAGNPGVDIWDYYEGTRDTPRNVLKLVAVSTTAATGSETNGASVLSNGEKKRSLFCDAGRARFAFMNPELLYTLPVFQRRCTVADIFVHTHERYCAHHGENRISDACSEGNMRVLLECGEAFVDQVSNYDAASEVMFAGTFAYMACGIGGPADWSTHNLAHEISGHFPGLTHATTVTAMWESWARYVYRDNLSRFVQFAHNVHGVTTRDNEAAAMLGIEKTVEFFGQRLGLPTSLRRLMGRKLTPEEIHELADSCTYRGRRPTIGTLRELDYQDMVNVYNAANDTGD